MTLLYKIASFSFLAKYIFYLVKILFVKDKRILLKAKKKRAGSNVWDNVSVVYGGVCSSSFVFIDRTPSSGRE